MSQARRTQRISARGRRQSWMVGLATVLLAALAWPAVFARAGQDPSSGAKSSITKEARKEVRVVIELFQVALGGPEDVLYLHRQKPLDIRGPDAVVADLLHGASDGASFFDGAPAIVHSTSWRFESDGTVILTYVAYGEEPAIRSKSDRRWQSIRKSDLPQPGPTDPDKPRPASLRQQDVLAHGLRHLALLARRSGNQALVARLSQRSRDFFASIEPEIAGQIGGDFSTSREAR